VANFDKLTQNSVGETQQTSELDVIWGWGQLPTGMLGETQFVPSE
jgi:hypothetical protein